MHDTRLHCTTPLQDTRLHCTTHDSTVGHTIALYDTTHDSTVRNTTPLHDTTALLDTTDNTA